MNILFPPGCMTPFWGANISPEFQLGLTMHVESNIYNYLSVCIVLLFIFSLYLTQKCNFQLCGMVHTKILYMSSETIVKTH